MTFSRPLSSSGRSRSRISSRETEFVSLKGDGSYPFIGGDLVSSDGVRKQEHEYKAMTNEYLVEQSTSKWSRLSRESFAVGALARVNNNFALLHPAAQEIATSFGLKPVNHNPYHEQYRPAGGMRARGHGIVGAHR